MANSNNTYRLNLVNFVAEYLPTALRQPDWIWWVYSQVSPLKSVYEAFITLRDESIYKIEHTPTVYSMVNVFNDAFDSVLRRIRIVDGVYKAPIYFYEPEETSPIHFYEPEENNPVHFYEPEELINLDVDFIILVPANLNLTEHDIIRLRSLCDFYRSPDKTYEIRIDNE